MRIIVLLFLWTTIRVPAQEPAWLQYAKQSNSVDKTKPTWEQINTSVIENAFQRTGKNYQGSGRVEALYISPSDSNTIYAASNSGGLFKTTNGGKLWKNCTNNPKYRGYAGTGVHNIGVNPLNENHILLSTGNRGFFTENYGIGLIESFDAGNTWKFNEALFSALQRDDAILVSKPFVVGNAQFLPWDTSVILATCFRHVYKSNNAGKSWTKVYSFPNTAYSDIHKFKLLDMEFDKKNKRIFITGEDYVLANGGLQIIKSNDDGNTWQTIELPTNWSVVENGNFEQGLKNWAIYPTQTNMRVENNILKIELEKGKKYFLYNTNLNNGLAPNSQFNVETKMKLPKNVTAHVLLKENTATVDFSNKWNDEKFDIKTTKKMQTKHWLNQYVLEIDATKLKKKSMMELYQFQLFPTSLELANVEIAGDIAKILYLTRPWKTHIATYDLKQEKMVEDYFNPNDLRLAGADYVSWDCDYNFIVSNTNPDIIYIGNNMMRKSTDGGRTFTTVSSYNGVYKNSTFTHADIRSTFPIRFTDKSAGNECFKTGCYDAFYMGTDGGVSYTNSGTIKGYTNLNGEGFIATQVEGLGLNNTNKQLMSYGAWDNGINIMKENQWNYVMQADGFDTENDENNTTYAVTSGGGVGNQILTFDYNTLKQGKGIKKPYEQNIENKGNSMQNVPMYFHNETGVMYIATQEIYKDNKDKNFKKITNIFNSKVGDKLLNSPISAFYVHPKNSEILYMATLRDAEFPSQVFIQKNNELKNITPNLPFNQDNITAIISNPINENEIWISFSGVKLESNKKAILYSNNAGNTFVDMSVGLPPYPVQKLIWCKGTLYAGTDVGVFWFDTNNKQWKDFNHGLPTVIVTDMEYKAVTNTLVVSTWGQGLWQITIP